MQVFKFMSFFVMALFLFHFQSAGAQEYNPNCPETTLNFSMSPIGYDGVSEFTVDFTFPDYGTGTFYYSLASAKVNLPEELTFADPANIKSSCSEITVTADSVSNILTISNGGFRPFSYNNSTCEISVDVRGASLGTYSASIDDFQYQFWNMSGGGIQTYTCGSSSEASIEISASGFSKSFTDDPVGPGNEVTLEYTIVNRDRDNSAANISFTEDLDALIPGLAAVDLPKNDVCGAGSQISGTSVLTLTGGSLGSAESCTFDVRLQVPASVDFGKYLSISSDITMDVGVSPVTFPPAEDFLNINAALTVDLNILDNPVNSGDTIRLEYTLTNLSVTSSAADISMKDDFSEFLGVYPVSVGVLPLSGFCGAGSTISAVSFDSYTYGLQVSGASLSPGGSCTFTVEVTTPGDLHAGIFTDTVEEVSATVDAVQYSAGGASDNVTIYRAPVLFSSFEKPVAAPGETLNLEYTLYFNENDIYSTYVAFSQEFEAVMPGIVVSGLPKYGVCTSGTLQFLDGKIEYSGGTLATNTICEFEVPVTIPEDVQWKTYNFPTSQVNAYNGAYGSSYSPANTASLLVSGFDFTLEFIDDPLFPGESGIMRYTINNLSAIEDVTSMAFTHSLSGLNITVNSAMPMSDVCGSGSSLNLSGSTMIFTGGNLLAEEQCSFDIEFTVLSTVETGVYGTVTSNLSATVAGSGISSPAAGDILTVSNDVIGFTKSFSSDYVVAGSTIDLEYTITNTDTEPLTAITFSDDLDEALSGLVATGLPQNDVCGSGSIIDGTGVVSFSGGSLDAGATCIFTVTFQVPETASSGTEIESTSDQITGFIESFEATGPTAKDNFTVSNVEFTKTFSVYDPYTKTATLSYSIINLNSEESFTGIAFTDNVDALASGAVAVGMPQNDVCGAGSQLSGTSFLKFTGGELSPSGTCSFDVEIQFPEDVSSGNYSSSTSDLMHSGLFLAPAATAGLNIFPVPPVFSKSFGDETLIVGETTSLVFRINNLESDLPAQDLAFVDNLPAGIVPADILNTFVSCTGGTLAASGNEISYTGGQVDAGRICEIKVDVKAITPGTAVNVTGELTSSLGNSGTATDTITVEEAEVPDEGPDETFDEIEDRVDEEDDVDTGGTVDEISDEVTDETVDETQDEVADETVDETTDETPDETTDEAVTDNEINDEIQDEAANDETVDETTNDLSDEASDLIPDDDEIDDETKSNSDGCGCSLI